jgi:serine/threonine-protein kinase
MAIHATGIVHADIKSDNVLVDMIDGQPRIKLIDFGLARVQFAKPDVRPHTEREEWLSGTPEYMAPEIIRGEGACFASDLYSVGVILYEMLTGATPFGGGKATEVVQRHLSEDVVPPSLRRDADDIGSDLEYVVMRALAKDPLHRYASAEDFAAALACVRVSVHARSTRELRAMDHTGDDSPTLSGWNRRRLAKGTPAHGGTGRVRRPR